MSSSNQAEETDPNLHVEDGHSGGALPQEFLYCESCGNVYDDTESYDRDHSPQNGCCVGVSGELHFVEEVAEDCILEEVGDEDIVDADVPLWELVDEVPVNMKAEEEEEEEEPEPSNSDRYFCYDCHSIFENRNRAEEHICPRAESSGGSSQQVGGDAMKAPARRKLASVNARTGPNDASSVISCGICNTVFSSEKFLKFHMRIHENRAPKSIQDALPIGAHQQYSELDQFYCEICNKSFDETLLTIHKQMHQQETSEFMCSICNRRFEDDVTYQMHQKIHEKPRESEPIRRVNQRTSLDKDKPGFPCQYCERVFTRPFEKVKHERVHTGEKPYACEVCGKTFRVSYSLTLHLRTHTNIRPYVCTVCNKRFKSHQVYSHHMRIHSSERQFSCDACPKSFRTSVQLYAHKNTHTKPYQCAVCNRPFSSMFAVKNHMQTHKDVSAKEKVGTSRKTPSAQNSKSQAAGKFYCNTCGAEYVRLFALRLHIKSAHGLVEEQENPSTSPEAAQVAEADDSETAVLIAAAEADAAYINAVVNDVNVVGSVPTYEECVEFDVDNFHSEEVITDWLK